MPLRPSRGYAFSFKIRNFELSQRPLLQQALRQELRQCTVTDPILLAQHMDGLPFLDAVLMETLRLYSSNPGPWPRRVLPTGCILGAFSNIPAGIIISASSYALHRNAFIFPHPELWRPERRLNANFEERKEMMRWFWAFGSGARMCIGNHFAIHNLKLMTAIIYADFMTSIVDCNGMDQIDAAVAGPVGDPSLLEFNHV